MDKELEELTKTYDYILVGDGSGINKVCGWAVLIIDTIKEEARAITGVVSNSTINIAELLPYIHALNSIEPEGQATPRVLILSDSSITVHCGNGLWTPKANKAFWAAFEYLKIIFNIDLVHVERDTFEPQILCDKVAGQKREAYKEDNVFYEFVNRLGYKWEN